MIQFGQLVCCSCRKILSYPLGAPSCRCRNCDTVNAAQYLQLTCGCCKQSIVVPINTLSYLCPCCATVTDIPESLLPRVEEPVDVDVDGDKIAKTIYVTYPAKVKGKGKEEASKDGKKADASDDKKDEVVLEDGGKPTKKAQDDSYAVTVDKNEDDSQKKKDPSVLMVVATRII
ncbi:LSD1 zinc finger [Trypanosoma vivax]|uniref:Zinc finger LSD1-type domain-containing protein n=1 Tax=Trypanosoma vivax (strain Y486) TaxID=1055687 RepID=G0TYP1_TRYVY|nr:LSD1 zinc finger [Trypanosoma vivax]CCC49090.1 conserved hypothetical protein [Trypanosoma vivax Y486]